MRKFVAGLGACTAVLALLVSVAGLGLAATATAAPINGAERRTFEVSSGPTFFQAPAACPSFPDLTGRTPNLRTSIAGWYGPADDTGVFEVELKATVVGTVSDVAGNVYRVAGHFTEKGARNLFTDFQVFFRGSGDLVVTGPAGRYVGRATALVLGGPPERQLAFTKMGLCRTR